MSALDWAILTPAIPAIPLFITWWLPWEKWIPWEKIPKAFLGPYALYLSFVIWHFDPKKRWWAFGTWAVIGVLISVLAIIQKVKRKPTAESQAHFRS